MTRLLAWSAGAFCALAAILLAPAFGFLARGFAADSAVPLAPWFDIAAPYLAQFVAGLLSLALAWILELARRRLNLSIDAGHRAALETALANAAGLLVARGGAALAGRSVDVRMPEVATAIGYVQRGAPDALKRFGLGPEDIRDKVFAKVPALAGPAAPSGAS